MTDNSQTTLMNAVWSVSIIIVLGVLLWASPHPGPSVCAEWAWVHHLGSSGTLKTSGYPSVTTFDCVKWETYHRRNQ